VGVQIASALNSGFHLLPKNEMKKELHQADLGIALTNDELPNGTGVRKTDAPYPDHHAVTGSWLDESKSHIHKCTQQGVCMGSAKKESQQPKPCKTKAADSPLYDL
jgi:hypothetical protein